MHAQAVCTRPLLRGEGPGDQAMHVMAWSWSTKPHFYMKKSALPSNVLRVLVSDILAGRGFPYNTTHKDIY